MKRTFELFSRTSIPERRCISVCLKFPSVLTPDEAVYGAVLFDSHVSAEHNCTVVFVLLLRERNSLEGTYVTGSGWELKWVETFFLQSSAIGEAVYMSEWYRFGTEVNRALWIIMERSKRPMKLTAVKLFALSLDTFTSVSPNKTSSCRMCAVPGRRDG